MGAGITTSLIKNLAVYIAPQHKFTDDTVRNSYFSATPNELKDKMWAFSNNKLQRYESNVWVDRTAAIKGEKGLTGATGVSISNIVDVSNNTIRIYLDNGATYDVTKTQTEASNISVNKTNLKNIFKNFTGTTTQEIIEYIDLAASILSQNDVVDSLNSTLSYKPLSARQGKILKDTIAAATTGKSIPIFISVADFNALTSGNYADAYQLTDNGLLVGRDSDGIYFKDTIIYITNTFTGRAITTSDYSANNSGGSGASDVLFITDVTTSDVGKTVTLTNYPSPANESVQGVSTDATNLAVTVLWTFDKDNICPVPQVNGVSVNNISARNGSVYTGTATIDITSATNITATVNNTSYMVSLTKQTPPVISSINFGSLPGTQTELKQGDSVQVTIAVDKTVQTVEIQDFGAFSYGTYTVNSATPVVTATVADRGTTLQNLTAKMRVRSNGSWSNIMESVSTLPLNNTYPSVSFAVTTFPASQGALKGTESATLNFILSNTDVCTPSIIGNDLSLGTQTSTTLVVTRLNTGTTTYNDSTNNVSFALTRDANGATTTSGICVPIATVTPSLSSYSPNPYQVRSGVGQVNCTLSFDQKVKVSAISIAVGTLNTGVTSTYSTNYTLGITAVDGDTHSSSPVNATYTIVGMSGLSSIGLTTPYVVSGFASKVLTASYPSYSVSIGTKVINLANLTVSGLILTSPTFDVAKTYVTPANLTGATADKYSISADGLDFLLPTSVSSFGYDAGHSIQINIAET